MIGRGTIVAVACDAGHRFAKPPREVIRLVAGIGVEGDAHAGTTVQHRSRAAKTPDAPNLRQFHLIQGELLDELAGLGFDVAPGKLGENVTTRGIDLLGLKRGTRLRLGADAVIEVTGLRNPCRQIDDNVAPGAMAATLGRAADGSLDGGEIRPGDSVIVEWMPVDRAPLEPV